MPMLAEISTHLSTATLDKLVQRLDDIICQRESLVAKRRGAPVFDPPINARLINVKPCFHIQTDTKLHQTVSTLFLRAQNSSLVS
jgi:hypothetical protein